MSPRACVAVAYSGGRDSTALLHATVREAHARGDTDVLALHVHHGLSPHADAWLAHAKQLCDAWAAQGWPVRLCHTKVVVSHETGDSLEAQARQARYAALADMAMSEGADVVLLAHHQRDQAETLLLQALRGGGVAGLAAMPIEARRHGVRWLRPWLSHSREAIEAYVAQHALPFIEDDSNADTRFARNRLRLEVWPALLAAFPQAEASLAASAQHLADALPALTRAGRQSLADLGWLPEAPAHLPAQAWSELPESDRREVLRHWYREVSGLGLSASWLRRLAREVPAVLARAGHAHWAPVQLGLYRGVLSWSPVGEWAGSAQEGFATSGSLCIDAPGLIALPGWRGHLRVSPIASGGLSPAWLADARVQAREGGESFQLGAGRPARALKKQFQDLGVPAWARQGPLLWAGDRLLWVPGLGVDARVMAEPGAEQWALEWVPEGP